MPGTISTEVSRRGERVAPEEICPADWRDMPVQISIRQNSDLPIVTKGRVFWYGFHVICLRGLCKLPIRSMPEYFRVTDVSNSSGTGTGGGSIPHSWLVHCSRDWISETKLQPSWVRNSLPSTQEFCEQVYSNPTLVHLGSVKLEVPQDFCCFFWATFNCRDLCNVWVWQGLWLHHTIAR